MILAVKSSPFYQPFVLLHVRYIIEAYVSQLYASSSSIGKFSVFISLAILIKNVEILQTLKANSFCINEFDSAFTHQIQSSGRDHY